MNNIAGEWQWTPKQQYRSRKYEALLVAPIERDKALAYFCATRRRPLTFSWPMAVCRRRVIVTSIGTKRHETASTSHHKEGKKAECSMTARRAKPRRRRGQPKQLSPLQPTPLSSAAREESALAHQPPHSRPQLDHQDNDKKSQHYDVCIVGAGPAGLACLSAIMEQFSLDNMSDGQVTRAVRSLNLHRPRRVCVIDPHDDGWLSHWRHQFQTLGIDHLRSPALAHPHAYDQNALLAYAMAQQHGGRSATTADDDNNNDSLIESGIMDLKHILPLGQAQIGLWKLPSTKLFEDFCLDTVRSLPHDYVRGTVTDVHKNNNDNDGPFQVIVSDDRNHDNPNEISPPVPSTPHRLITADAVILALGVAGAPTTVPRALHDCPPHRLVPWHQLDRLYDNDHRDVVRPPVPTVSSSSSSSSRRLHYLVVGGGLTAAQVTLKICHDDPAGHVILCSRRILMERHFDIPIAWFDRRTATKCLYDFYHAPVSERLALLKATKDGGSIPPIYMTRLRRLVQSHQLTCLVGEPIYLREEEVHADETITTKSIFRIQRNENGTATAGMGDDKSDNKIYRFDKVIVACGTKPDCLQNPLVRNIYRHWPNIDICDGYPNVSADLQWTDRLYCVGSLGALHVGPDAANLMGMRRAALTIAQSLQCRGWLREKALTNPFAALFDDDDDDDDSSGSSETVQEDGEVAFDAISTSGSSDSSDL
jgi:hypothetical protein